MRVDARLARFLLGLRGLALLRGWPFDDAAEADQQVEEMIRLCGHPDRPPMSTVVSLEIADVDEAYGRWAETYDLGDNPVLWVEEPEVRRLLAGVPPGRALDAACGTGRYAAMLAEAGHDVVAVDASDAMLDRARARGIAAEFHRGDVRALPVPDGTFDVAVCALALTHVPDLAPAISELGRVVRPGGRVIISDMHPVATATGAHAFFFAGDGSRWVTRNYVHWAGDYIRAAVGAGLRVEGCHDALLPIAFLGQMETGEVRAAAEKAVVGLPLVVVWDLARPATTQSDPPRG